MFVLIYFGYDIKDKEGNKIHVQIEQKTMHNDLKTCNALFPGLFFINVQNCLSNFPNNV